MSDHHGDLGATIRAWRDRLAPAAVGLAAGGVRRSPGLRREEVAALAGISVDYLVRLEQGRAVSPSAQVLASLARALRLDPAERDHLYRQAGLAPPHRTTISAHLTPGLHRLIDRLPDTALSVFDAAWTLITWNATWAALMGDPSGWTGRDRNLAWRCFTRSPGTGSRITRTPAEHAGFERSIAADLRDAVGRYPDDPGLRQFVTDLSRASPRFAALWQEHRVGTRRADRKTVLHPAAGPLTLDCDVLTVDGSDLRIVLYSAAAGSEDASKLSLIATWGLQDAGPAG